MLRHYLAAMLRNFARNRLFSAISVLGLGIGLCGALLSVLVVRDQRTQGRFIAGHEHLYQVVAMVQAAGQPAEWSRSVDARVAGLLGQHTAAAKGASRLGFENGGLQNGAKGADELIYWVDANFFDLVPLRVISGDSATALRRPDGLVLDRSAARRYFGRDDAVGETLQLRSAATRVLHPMTVTAVLEDLPETDTTFQSGIFASGLAPFSPLAQADAAPGVVGSNTASVRTYVRIESDAAMNGLGNALREVAAALPARTDNARTALELVRIDRLNLHEGLTPGFMVKIAMMLLMGAIIVLVAAVNFVNLMTARAGQRALEVGIRKAAGATRALVVLQFLAEALVFALLGTVLAIALTEWLLPHVNSFLNSGAEFNYWRDPVLAAGLLATPLLLALLAGAWPAQVLSSFRPGIATAAFARSQGNLLRQILVTTQFALLIALMIAAGVVFQQRHFALNQALRVNTDQMLMMWAPCREGFLNDLRAIPGVRGFACSGWQWINEDSSRSAVRARDGSPQNLWVVPVDLAAFDLYELAPLAGRLTLDATGREYPRDAARYVINESAARQLGFRNVQEAVGQQIDIPPTVPGSSGGHVVIGVVPDFSLVSVEHVIKPTAYVFEPSQQYLVSVKLAANDMAATLAAIDRAWAATGAKEPANRFFLDARLEQMYLALLRQAQAFGAIALATLVLAVFGLFGLAAAAVARRTREIGIRKALGAQTSDVLRLLLWQFGKPVLWANFIAWPLAGLAMRRWLDGFAYHIALPLWMFPAAALLALLIALATVSAHALRVASAKPVMALRHE
ncbi:MAG: FtsX-like permease family protein [Pseudomonadota bacterium]